MAEHKEHYPTMIENPETQKRVAVSSPYDHHRQLLAWKLPGLDPLPAAPEAPDADEPQGEPGYPRMIENEKTGERAAVYSQVEHDAKLAFWAAKAPPKSTTRVPAPPPAPASPAKPAAKAATAGKTAKGAKPAPTPPTKEDFMKKNYPESLAQRMADEEVRKYNAGEPPYNTEK